MRLFQNSGVWPIYLTQSGRVVQGASSFKAQIAHFLNDRCGGAHILAPVLNADDTAFFTIDADEGMQRAWAREAGMSPSVKLEDILLAQIESHRTEVFYNTAPARYGSDLVRRLPGCVRHAIAWSNIPSVGAFVGGYHLVLCNSTSMLKYYADSGLRAAYFSPAHDPAMDEYANNEDRPIDVLFVGGYSRHHMGRAAVLESVASLRDRYRIVFCLARSRFTRLAESPFGYLAPLAKYRRPKDIRVVSQEPVFGREMYALLSKAKIVLNGTIDMSGEDRGNLRCFESMGCRCLLLSDEGMYPEGMENGKTLVTYSSPDDVRTKVSELLNAPGLRSCISDAGYKMITQQYSKKKQWEAFCALIPNA